uniref:CSON008728 protein n=1 Tax=Culicoides sonorensis TaxID=179676 RepID=A0A336LZ01_CULSO
MSSSCDAVEIFPDSIEFKECLGVGTYGTVYKALYNEMLVAVKKNKEGSEKQYFREKTGLMQVNHENIIKLLGFNDSHRYLIIELCEDNLHNIIHNRKHDIDITWNYALTWARDCAKAIAYLHGFQPKPLLHRDLKPGNVLLTNEMKIVKLTDFGTVREEEDEMTSEIGTASYIAPEVCQGDGYAEYTTKCDVFSWSIMLWEILCRKQPFEKLENVAIYFVKIEYQHRPRELKNCPDSIKILMEQCWETDPDKRPNMNEVVEQMEKICEFNASDDVVNVD